MGNTIRPLSTVFPFPVFGPGGSPVFPFLVWGGAPFSRFQVGLGFPPRSPVFEPTLCSSMVLSLVASWGDCGGCLAPRLPSFKELMVLPCTMQSCHLMKNCGRAPRASGEVRTRGVGSAQGARAPRPQLEHIYEKQISFVLRSQSLKIVVVEWAHQPHLKMHIVCTGGEPHTYIYM